MKTIATLLLAALSFVFAVMGEPTAGKVGHAPKLSNLDQKEASFARVKPLVATLNDGSRLVVYRGVPRPNLSPPPPPGSPEPERKPTITRFASNFYRGAIPVPKQGAGRLMALIQDPNSFMKFGGTKPCGGFHPDFALVRTGGDDDLEMHFCFGCREIKMFRGEVEVHCDIGKEAYGQFTEMLGMLAKLR